jgi:hypothetical protein
MTAVQLTGWLESQRARMALTTADLDQQWGFRGEYRTPAFCRAFLKEPKIRWAAGVTDVGLMLECVTDDWISARARMAWIIADLVHGRRRRRMTSGS